MRTLTILIGVLLFTAVLAAPALAQQDGTPQTNLPPVLLPRLLERADSAAMAGNYAQAAVDYSLFLLLNPTFSPAYAARAINYQTMGESGLALEDLSRALKYGPESPQFDAAIYYTRATIHLNRNSRDLALNDLDSSIEAYPGSVDSLRLRAELRISMEEYPAALEDYNRLIELQPEETLYYLDRAFIQGQLGELQAALEDYSHAIELSPDDAVPYAQRGLLHATLNNFSDALDDLSSAIDISPNNSRLYLLRGSINSVADNTVEAASDYFQWITLNQTQRFVAPRPITTSGNFTIEMGPGWVYNIPFQAATGQAINIGATSVSQQSPIDPLLVILGIDGDPLIADDDSGGGMAALIRNYIIPEEGEYTLIIGQAAGGTQQGDVAVLVDLGSE